MNSIAVQLPVIAGFLAFLFAVSHLFSKESVRGAGRVLCGISMLVVSAHFFFAPRFPVQLPQVARELADYVNLAPQSQGLAATLFGLAGLLTIVCGARKFMRRNLPSN